MPNPNISGVPQFPLNSGGVLGPHAFWAIGKIHIGTGGMPGPGRIQASGGTITGIPAVYGLNDFSATYVGSGVYDIRHPPCQIVSVNPVISAPSGQFFGANIVKTPSGGTASGIMTLQVQRLIPTGFTSQLPPSGTRIDLHFWFNPSNDQGLAQF